MEAIKNKEPWTEELRDWPGLELTKAARQHAGAYMSPSFVHPADMEAS
jgi:hypothetical protein